MKGETTNATQALLLRLRDAPPVATSLGAYLGLMRRGVSNLRQVQAYAALAGSEVYVYGWPDDNVAISNVTVEALRTALAALVGGAFTLDRLELVRVFDGASEGAPAPFFYAVETDPAPGWEAEMFRWYDSEHMPGLAAVPGCVRALRLINRDGEPRSHACYALADRDVTTTPAWLAVRASAWSARVRPNFRNTRRTMFRAL